MKNRIMRVCAIALTVAIVGGSALPYALAESDDTPEVSTESDEGTVSTEVEEPVVAGMVEESTESTTDVTEEVSTEVAEEVPTEVTEESVEIALFSEENSIAVQDGVQAEETPAVDQTDGVATTAASGTLEDVCTYTTSGTTMVLTGVKTAGANVTVPKQYAIGGVTYNVQVNFSVSANKVGTLSFESGYDLTDSLAATKETNTGLIYYTLFKNCASIDLSNVTFTGDVAMDGWFYQCTDLQTVKFPAMSISSMKNTFEGDSALTSVNVGNLNTANCKKAIKTFYGCTSLTTLNVSGWDLTSMTELDQTFANCTKLSSLDLSQWSSTQDISFNKIVDGDTALDSIALNNLHITNSNSVLGDGVKNVKYTGCQFTGSNSAYYIFNGASLVTAELKDCSVSGASFGVTPIGKAFTKLTIDSCTFPSMKRLSLSNASKLTTASITNSSFPVCVSANEAFYEDTELQSVDLSGSSFPVLTDASWMFRKCGKLQTLDLSVLGQSDVQSMEAMCYDCTALKSVTFGENAELSDLTTLRSAFGDCESLESVNFGKAKFDKLTSLYGTFSDCAKLSSVDFGNEATFSALTNLYAAFNGCEALTSVNFGKATMSNVTSFYSAFRGCHALKTLDVSGWDVSSGTDFGYMFSGCRTLENIDVSKWKFNDSAPIDAKYMFNNCWAVKTLDVSNWNTRMFSDMHNLFYACLSVRTLDVSKWDVCNVESMYAMFSFLELPYLDLSNWKLYTGVDTALMFTDSYIKTLSTPDGSEVSKLSESLASTWAAGTAKDTNEQLYNHYLLLEQVKGNKYHKVLDKTEVLYLKKDLPAGTVLSRICVNFYGDKAKTQLIDTEWPAYGTATTTTGTWYSCVTDEVVNLNSVTDSIDVYSTSANVDNGGNGSGSTGDGSNGSGSTGGGSNGSGSTGDQQINNEPASGGGLVGDEQSGSTDNASTGNSGASASPAGDANASTGDTSASTGDANAATGNADAASGEVKTGDSTNIWFYAIALIAGLSLVGTQVVRRYRK